MMREEVEDERSDGDVILEGRRAGEVLGTDDAADVQHRAPVGANLRDCCSKVVLRAQSAQEDA